MEARCWGSRSENGGFSLRKVACFISAHLISSSDSAQQKSRVWVESVCRQVGCKAVSAVPDGRVTRNGYGGCGTGLQGFRHGPGLEKCNTFLPDCTTASINGASNF